MEKTKKYKNTIFAVETLKNAISEFNKILVKNETNIRAAKAGHPSKADQPVDELLLNAVSRKMQITRSNVTWTYDSEDEFYSDYREHKPDSIENYFYYKRTFGYTDIILESVDGTDTKLSVDAWGFTDNRTVIERVFGIFEADAEKSKIPFDLTVKPKIFIGHGRNKQWRDLKDHLHDKHSYEVVAYEVGARAGHAIRDVLEDMLSRSSFAILVMTAEDQITLRKYRARQNVVHEIGLFQGRLGFNRAVILMEKGVEAFSNISGLEQIRFAKGNIKETYGEVLATIKREFY